MKKNESNRINQTFSLPLDISQELHIYVKRREMSHFVSEAIRKELDYKKDELRKAYFEGNNDPGQREGLEDLQGTIGDGSEEW